MRCATKAVERGKWINTSIKAVHKDSSGQVRAYDCSGKLGAAVNKVRARKSAPAAAPAAPDANDANDANGSGSKKLQAEATSRRKLGLKQSKKMQPKALKELHVFQVHERAWYWSSQQKKWLHTRIQGVNLGPDGEIVSYDCSGKPKAAPHKLRPRVAKTEEAKAAAEEPKAPAESTPAVTKTDSAKVKESAMYQVGQKVLYLSGQLKKYVFADVVKVLRSKSGKRYYDLSIKKSVPEARLRPVQAGARKDSEPEAEGAAETKDVAKTHESPRKRWSPSQVPKVPPPPPSDMALGSDGPPGPPSP
ncbi:unnamed protein product [Effrenium voratum]|nr:unnamed protein product [Effrenium voratum]